jgi:hypothetical protein
LRTTQKGLATEGTGKVTVTKYICGPPGLEPEEIEDTEAGDCCLFTERF